MNSWSSPLGGSAKTATRFAMPLCTRSAASSAPAPAEFDDMTMMSAGATGSLTTSAHPAVRRTCSRTERTATMAAAANATTTSIGAHLGRRELILEVMERCGSGVMISSSVGSASANGAALCGICSPLVDQPILQTGCRACGLRIPPHRVMFNRPAATAVVDGITVEYRRKDGSIAGAQAPGPAGFLP